MTPTEIAYTAGLFEGEGCIYIAVSRKIRLTLTSTDEDVVRRFVSTVGVGTVFKKTKRPLQKQQYIWQCNNTKATALLQLWLPWLGSRRTEKALLAVSLNNSIQPFK